MPTNGKRNRRGAVTLLSATSVSAYIQHVVAKLATLTIGAAYVSRPLRQRRLLSDQRHAESRFLGRAALVAHVFYPHLLDEIIDCFKRFPKGSELLITTPYEQADVVKAALEGRADATIVPVKNQGRDIAPFILLLKSGLLDPYDAVLKLHTKRSPHLRDGELRRKLLFDVLAGSRRRVEDVLSLFSMPEVGLVGWRMSWRCHPSYWMSNHANVEDLARQLGVKHPKCPQFFEGSMFWCRPASLSLLKQIDLARFESESGQLDGTWHHAIERIFDPVIRDAGFLTFDLKGRLLSFER